ncbi:MULTISPECIES: DUF4169 family protein [Hyphomicrobiales]|jgi:hypothetical protein|uniref:DUF4169 family protein n=1 Tax=Hyphomicrobiales TaxID=356 RepID=UPI0003810164|nr:MULTISPECIES: DUF4169 family protein [Phyllobacteriaceae]MCX8571329.1 DUF4169 family protein [Aminobacter sp. MET-1]
MADIVNLRQFKKQKARGDREAQAEQNRALHGRTKAEKQRDRLTIEQAEKFVEAHRRDRRSKDGEPRDDNPQDRKP